MHPITPATFLALMFLEVSRMVVSMYVAGIALLVIGAMAAKNNVADARGLDKIVALGNLCFAMPLAVFAAEHFADAKDIMQLVPKFVPWHLFWTYLVGVALLAASLSIATKIQVRWSGLLFGVMMFLFVSMMDLPGTLAHTHNRFSWALLCRELSFGAGGWCLAATAMDEKRGGRLFLTVGRLVIGSAAMFYGVEHFLNPLHVPGIPLEMVMPAWIPGRVPISYVTGLILIVAGACILLGRKMRMAATYLGSWIFLVVLLIYGPILVASLLNPGSDVKVEGMNYFFDTLLYAGTILALARATPREG